MSLKALGEFGFIRAMLQRHPLPGPFSSLVVPAGDDACAFKPSAGCDLLATCDLLVEGVHFDLSTIHPWQLGAKALAVSLSDIAAMGGMPRYYLVSLAIPKRRALNQAFFKAFYDGLAAWGSAFGAVLAGGDTTASPHSLVIDISLMGEVEAGRSLLRSGAKVGDRVYVTGALGGSAAGLACLKNKTASVDKNARALAVQRHLLPTPRFLAGRYLLTQKFSKCCIDISDGLASEAHHLCQDSSVGMELVAEAIPLHGAATVLASKFRQKALDWALYGGEDYELLFTVPEDKAQEMEYKFNNATGIRLACIGRVTPKGRGLRLLQGKVSKPLLPKGYNHFSV
jgi:thiamine-monophosphate kinase